MGCDIHIIAERRDSTGAWKLIGEARRDEEGWMDMPEPYNGRNYDLFAILANVRNGIGFAGCDTGDGFKPIAMPRGIADDASPEFKEWAERWGRDGHSHSWLTVRELMECDWTQTTKHRGWANAATIEKWDGKSEPSDYCGGVSGRDIEHVTVQEIRRRLPEMTPEQKRNYYAVVEWGQTYGESVGEFLTDTLPKLVEFGDPDNVRICFFFDN